MHTQAFKLNTLFAQLGLEHSDEAVDRFVRDHGPIPADLPIDRAPCWNEAQAVFLRESVADDADWADVVDQLDALLRKPSRIP